MGFKARKRQPLSPEMILTVIKREKIKLNPVLGKRNKLLYWVAGRKRLGADGWTNIVRTDEFWKADTPEEALAGLLPLLNIFERSEE